MTEAEKLRADIAAKVLAGMLASNGAGWDIGPDKVFTACEAVNYADALIESLKMPPGQCRWKP